MEAVEGAVMMEADEAAAAAAEVLEVEVGGRGGFGGPGDIEVFKYGARSCCV